MSKLIFLLVPVFLYADFFRVNGDEKNLQYSTKIDVLKFESSKIISLFSQSYDLSKNEKKDEKVEIKYIYYFKTF